MDATISAVLLDLDETILYDDAATDTALAATASHAERLAGIDPACLVAAVREEALALWQAGPHTVWCDDIGTSEVEALRSRFEGDDPRMAEMREWWGPEFRRESWRRALLIGGLLVALFAVLYVLLSLEAFSLQIGSLLLFAALAGVMYGTRRIDWSAHREEVVAD